VSTEKQKNFNNLIVNQHLKTAWNSSSIDHTHEKSAQDMETCTNRSCIQAKQTI